MNTNEVLNKARNEDNDEFYTLFTTVEQELVYYNNIFAYKTVYCNCDNPITSNFVKWLYSNFDTLHLKRIMATAYNSHGQGQYFNTDSCDDKYLDAISAKTSLLNGNGDFRSDECIELLKQADIVVTNPPFSLFRDFITLMMKYDKKFIVIGHQNAITYNEIFPYIQSNKIQLGYSIHAGDREFRVSDDYPINTKKSRVDSDGNKYISVTGIRWFTNIRSQSYNKNLILFQKYTSEQYPKYDNCDAINVDKTCNIPADYDGVIGVPVTFLDKYNPDQFQIVGKINNPTCNGKKIYKRLLIKKTPVLLDN
jgi:hypothetical protein